MRNIGERNGEGACGLVEEVELEMEIGQQLMASRYCACMSPACARQPVNEAPLFCTIKYITTSNQST